MSNPKDFLAKQIRTNTLIVSGGNWAIGSDGSSPGLLIYSASLAPDFVGGRPDKLFSGSGNFGMVQIYQTAASISGGLAVSNTHGGNVRIAFDQEMDINPHSATQRVTKAHVLLGSGSNAVPFITFVSGSSSSPGGTTQRMFLLSQSIGGTHPHTSSNTAANNPYNMLDVNFWVSGSKGSKRSSGTPGSHVPTYCGTAVFGGDLVVSGTLYAERQVIEVDVSQSGSLFVSGSAEIGGGMIVNEHGGSVATQWRNRDSNNFLYFNPAGAASDGTIGIGNMGWTAANPPASHIHFGDTGTTTNSAATVFIVDYATTGTPADGIGTRIVHRVENSAGSMEMAVMHENILTDVTNGTEDAAYVVKTMTAGATATEKFRVGSTETVVNEGNIDHDFRVEGNSASATHLLYVDASLDRVVVQGATGDDTELFKVIGNDDAGSGQEADFLTVSPTKVVINEDGQTVDFRVEGKNRAHALFVNSQVASGFDQVLILSGGGSGGSTDNDDAAGTDVAFYVSGSTSFGGGAGRTEPGTYGISLFGGDLHSSGNITADGRVGPWVDGGTFVYPYGTEHLVLGATTIAASDIILSATGSATFNNQSSANGDFRIKSQTDESMVFVDASGDVVGIGTDAPNGSAQLHVGNSGASSLASTVLYLENESASSADVKIWFGKNATVKHAIGLDDDDSDKLKIVLGGLLGASNKTLMDFPSAFGNAIVVNESGQDLDFRIESENDANLFVVDASTDSIGINVAAGSHGARLDILANDASERGLLVTSNPGSGLQGGDVAQFISGSSEVFSIGGSDGDVVVNEAGADRDFRVETSGDDKAFVVDGGTNTVVINEDGDGADFRVETAGEDEALFIDASANTIYINKGEQAVTTIIGSTNDEAIRVGSAGVVFNEDGHATNDFRVESDSKDHTLWVDSGRNFVGILTGSEAIDITLTGGTKAGTDVCLFVSGSNDKDTQVRGVSVFGGDVVVSGTLYDGSGNAVTKNYGKMAVLDTGGSTEGTAEAGSVGDTFRLKEGTGIGLSINTGTDTVTISANIGTASPAFTDRGFQTGHVEKHRGTSIICTSSIAFVSGNHIGGVSPVAYDASNVGTDTFFFVSGSIGGKAASAANRHGVATFGGDAVISGTFYTGGNTVLGDATSDSVTFNGRVGSHILPSADSTYNLGSNSLRFANVYTGDLHLRNDRGNWTIYEEPDMLVVVNNLTGKKYKMGLTPLEDDE